MIKIIISGTSDGFYPRYASDGILEDGVTQQILDRRRFLSRGEDRLYKEGYSFQQLAGEYAGILYHKLILLYDGFGRDGFMMASIFMPEGDKLEGTDIKDALDTLIRDYKSRTTNGMANVELDWTFVKNKADELNAKVQPMMWRKHPANTDSSRTALIRGVGERVADYFQYPNPLNSGCAGYGQVFLTENLMDPAMVSEDGEQGYKVLTTDDVDIDNIEYAIVYENEQPGASLSSRRSTISKKELEKFDTISFGKYTAPGYRDATVTISGAEKISRDGMTITVKLPTLVQKSAKVEFSARDEHSGKAIELNDYDIKWTEKGEYSQKYLPIQKNKITFKENECDKTWCYTVKCDKYEAYEGEIRVEDGMDIPIHIPLKPEPLWVIVVQYPNGETKSKKDVPAEYVQYQTQKIVDSLRSMGLDVELPVQEDKKAHKITVVGKTKQDLRTEEYRGLTSRGAENNGDRNERGGGDTMPRRERYFLFLDDQSRNYSLFRNYRKKKEIEKRVSVTVDKLKKQRNEAGFVKKEKDKVDAIISALEKKEVGKAESARKGLNDLYVSVDKENRRIEQILALSKEAIRALKKAGKTKAVVEQQSISYNPSEHRLEKEGGSRPGTYEVQLGSDMYNYYIPNPKWFEESKETIDAKKSVVKRKLSTPYKVLISFFVVVVVSLIGVLVYKWNQKPVDDSKVVLAKEIYECYNEMNKPDKRYCGDSLYNHARELTQQHSQLTDEGRDSLEKTFADLYGSFAYNLFENSFKEQTKRKRLDSEVYKDGLILLDSSPRLSPNFDRMDASKKLIEKNHLQKQFIDWQEKWNSLMERKDYLTRPHEDTLMARHQRTVQKINEQIPAKYPVQNESEEITPKKAPANPEEDLYKSCISDKTSIVGKAPIETYEDLWNALIWENFQEKGWNTFSSKYEFVGDNSSTLIQLALDITNAVSKWEEKNKKKKFNDARNDADKKIAARKKLEELKKLLQ